MYLLRYGLFLMFSGAASLLATFPIQGAIGLLAVAQLCFVLLGRKLSIDVTSFSTVIYFLMFTALVLIFFSGPITEWLKRAFSIRSSQERLDEKIRAGLTEIKEKKSTTLGV